MSDAPHTILAVGNRLGRYYPRIAEIPVHTNDVGKALGNVTSALTGQHAYVVLGGEHTITLAILRAVCADGPPPHLVMFDAHTDEYGGAQINCGNWLTTAKQEGLINGCSWINYRDRKATDIPPSKRYHISVDIDVLAPIEYAWASNYPALGGCSLHELVEDICGIAGESVTADLVEYQPRSDTGNRTGGHACALILDALLSVVH